VGLVSSPPETCKPPVDLSITHIFRRGEDGLRGRD
jgi:hypothetical protein